MYIDHLQNWLFYGLGLWIFLILILFWLSETGQIWGFQAYQCSKLLPVHQPEADNFGGGPGTFLKLFFNFMFMIWDSRQQDWQLFWSSFEHWGISWRMHGGNGLKFCMLMYLDHLQNWLVLGHGLLSFVILALFWLSETGQIWGFRAFPGECMDGMAWNMVCCCILTTFRTD